MQQKMVIETNKIGMNKRDAPRFIRCAEAIKEDVMARIPEMQNIISTALSSKIPNPDASKAGPDEGGGSGKKKAVILVRKIERL